MLGLAVFVNLHMQFFSALRVKRDVVSMFINSKSSFDSDLWWNQGKVPCDYDSIVLSHRSVRNQILAGTEAHLICRGTPAGDGTSGNFGRSGAIVGKVV